MAAKMTYEQAMARLEEIVTKLDDGSLPLDESISSHILSKERA